MISLEMLNSSLLHESLQSIKLEPTQRTMSHDSSSHVGHKSLIPSARCPTMIKHNTTIVNNRDRDLKLNTDTDTDTDLDLDLDLDLDHQHNNCNPPHSKFLASSSSKLQKHISLPSYSSVSSSDSDSDSPLLAPRGDRRLQSQLNLCIGRAYGIPPTPASVSWFRSVPRRKNKEQLIQKWDFTAVVGRYIRSPKNSLESGTERGPEQHQTHIQAHNNQHGGRKTSRNQKRNYQNAFL